MKKIKKMSFRWGALVLGALAAVILIFSCCDKIGNGGETDKATEEAGGTATETPGDTTDTSDVTGSNETEEPAPEKKTRDGVIYRIYNDHAVVIGMDSEYGYDFDIPQEFDGIPVTEIAKGALDGAKKGARLICNAKSKVFDEAREYAEKNGLVFIESGSGKRPNHFYPDFIEKLKWSERDRTGDRFVAEDDNADISALVNEYISGNKKHSDELMRRVLFRYASANMLASYSMNKESFQYYVSDPANQYRDETTDYDRYDVYLVDKELGDSYAAYRFAYGSITTYEGIEAYVKLFYTEEKAETFLDEIANIEGEAYIPYTGMGYMEYCVNPVFSLEVAAEKITLHEKREVWDNDVDLGGKFAGEYRKEEFVLELHDGKWQAPYVPLVMVNFLDMPKVYDSLYK